MNNISQSGRRVSINTVMLGMIGAAVLIITVLISYSTRLVDENARLTGQVVAVEDDRIKSLEKISVTKYLQLSDGESGNIKIQIRNDGPTAAAYQYVLLYCVSQGCAESRAPLINPSSVIPAPPIGLGPSESREIEVGPVSDGLAYRVDVVTEQGNIVSTDECKANLAKQICESSIVGMTVQ